LSHLQSFFAQYIITPGSGFGAKGEGYFRISAFNSRANAEQVARRLWGLKMVMSALRQR
jgi:LL-diaminopimelate aminotransferase